MQSDRYELAKHNNGGYFPKDRRDEVVTSCRESAAKRVEKLNKENRGRDAWKDLFDSLRELTEACKRLPASDGRVVGLLPIIERCERSLSLAQSR